MEALPQIDILDVRYGARIMTFLKRCAEACRANGLYANAPTDQTCDTYEWGFMVWNNQAVFCEGEEPIDVRMEIAEARDYGDDPEDGINFGLTIVHWGGEIVGGLTPYNYTENCWVSASDPDAVEARWKIFEDEVDPAEIPDTILNWIERKVERDNR